MAWRDLKGMTHVLCDLAAEMGHPLTPEQLKMVMNDEGPAPFDGDHPLRETLADYYQDA